MVGDAAYQSEANSDTEIVAGVTEELARMFKMPQVPIPRETIVTRWGKDRFACGTYSFVGAESLPGDYGSLAKSIGNLHFAGEATCGTHPATVHGAYISGLRVASEIIDEMLGPIELPHPLVGPAAAFEPVEATIKQESPNGSNLSRTKPKETEAARKKRLDEYETQILQTIFAAIGYQPAPPGRPGSNPFLLYTAAKWTECRQKCDEIHQANTGDSKARAPRDAIRAAMGLMWRQASDEERKPFLEQTECNRQNNAESAATYEDRLAAWNAKAVAIRTKYVQDHPGVLSAEEEKQMWEALGVRNDLEDDQTKTDMDCSL